MSKQWRIALVMAVLGVLLTSYLMRDSAPDLAESDVLSSPESSAKIAASPPSLVTQPVADVPPPVEKADIEFQTWVRQEAKQLDSISVDSDAKLSELRARVARLTPSQSKLLLDTARSKAASAGEKILSTYLLIEAVPGSRGELQDFIGGPLQESGAHEAHSEAEMNGIREKSLRIMAIDGWAAKSKSNLAERKALARAIPNIQDSNVRSYAEEKLKEVSRQ